MGSPTELNVFNDERGTLVPIDFLKNTPFNPKRIFYVYGVPINTWRGGHAHYNTKQLLICIKGGILVKLETKNEIVEYFLEKNQTCFIDNMVWDSQKFIEEDSILLVLCSTEYDKDDYIFDMEKFKNL